MSVEKALRFVLGAVARKDHVEALCHVEIAGGKAIAYDGMLSMSTPIEIGLHVRPHARSFLKAIQACRDGDAIALHVTPAGRLSIKAGNFKALVDALPTDTPMDQPLPEGDMIELPKGVLDSIRTLAPLMSVDASRPWARGLLLCGKSTFATNNIILAQYWHGADFPREVIVPADAVNEMLRLNMQPTHAQMTENSITFHFEGDRWLRTALVDGEWPHERISAMLDQGGNCIDLPQEYFEQVARLKPFVDTDQGIRLYPEYVTTSASEDEKGARIEYSLPGAAGHFNIQQFLALEGIAKKIDFSTHPRPCYWQGGLARGVIIGRAD